MLGQLELKSPLEVCLSASQSKSEPGMACPSSVLFGAGGSGTTAGASRKLTALPRLFRTMATPVAVVRSSGGNQAAETAEGAENTMMPATPFRMAHT